MYKNNVVNKKTSKTPLLVLCLLLLVVGAGGGYLLIKSRQASPSGSGKVQKINYGPPTKAEQQAGDDQKDQIAQQQSDENKTSTTTPATQTNANVVISDASQYDTEIEVRAFVSNLLEDGTCNYTFTSGSKTVTKQAPAMRDAQTTICKTLDVQRSEFSVGTWKVVVSYASSSSNAAGSNSQTFNVK